MEGGKEGSKVTDMYHLRRELDLGYYTLFRAIFMYTGQQYMFYPIAAALSSSSRHCMASLPLKTCLDRQHTILARPSMADEGGLMRITLPSILEATIRVTEVEFSPSLELTNFNNISVSHNPLESTKVQCKASES